MNKKLVRREEIASHYEVSPRTIQRYVDELIAGGVPIESAPGRRGGYYLPDNYKVPFVLFKPEELSRLTTCIDALSSTFNDGVNRDVKDKLVALSEGKTVPLAQPPVVVDSDAWNGSSGAMQSKIDVIGMAIENKLTLSIKYIDKMGKFSNRLLDPYTLAFKAGVWYVYGWCHTRKEFRLFRLARIKSLEIGGEYVSRSGADVRSALAVNLGENISIQLRFSEECLPSVEEWLGASAVKPDGEKYVVKAIVGDGKDLVKKILSLGSGVEVLSPESLKNQVKAEATKILDKYSEK